MTTSPRFTDRSKKLKKFLTQSNLTEVWNKHVRQANRQQVVTDLADYYDVHAALAVHVKSAIKRLLSGRYVPEAPLRVLLEKSRGLCRQLVVPAAIDALVLQVLVNSIISAVLANQPSANAFYQPQSHKFTKSRQERIEEGEYGSNKSWLGFQKRVFNFSKFHEYLLVTDVANFFDYVQIDQLRSIYESFDGINEIILDLIFFILDRYHWRPDYIPGVSPGLPQSNRSVKAPCVDRC